MSSEKEMYQALHPDPTKQGMRVTKAHFDAYHAALLQVIPATEEGVFYSDLAKLVEPLLSAETLANTKSMWWITTVKLDMEARNLIERVPGRGKQRVRLTTA